jgi:hypothetical protein
VAEDVGSGHGADMRFCRHDGRGRKTRLLRFWTLSHAVRLGTPFLPPCDSLNLAHFQLFNLSTRRPVNSGFTINVL